MKNMKNMKRQIGTVGALTSSALLLAGVLSQTAQANTISPGPIVLGTPGSSVMATPYGPVTDYLTANWEVTLSAGVYTYLYDVSNPITDTDTVDSYIVTVPSVDVIGGSAAGGTSATVGPTGVTWTFPPVGLGGTSALLSFKSLLPPVYGAANAADSAPPSPWSTLALGGTPVPVPGTLTVPDGGLTVALLGGSLIALQALNRKKVRS